MAVELASAYISLIPSMKGAAKSITSQLGGVNVAPVGKTFGMQISKGIGQSLKASVNQAILAPAKAALEGQATATRILGEAEQNLAKARAGNQSAQAKVTAAEEKLARLRESGEASTGQLKVAEAELNAAKVALADTNIKVGTSEDAVARARESSTAANEAYSDSLKKTSTLSGRLSSALPAIGQHIKNVGANWKDAGQKISGVGKTLTTKITAPAAAAGGAIAGIAIAGGWKRLVGIENAKASLAGLGHSAETVEAIMVDANASVKGTAFGLDTAATVAASAVAAGIKPGKELQRTLKLTGDAATIAKTDMATMGSVINKVATSDMMQMDVANQMMDAGIPILQLVGKEMGVTAEEARELASKGKVSFETFQNALESGLGGAALKSGETMTGSFANMRAALSRLGATALSEVFPQIKTALGDLQTAFDSPAMKEFAAVVGEQVGAAFSTIANAIKGAITWFSALSPAMQKTTLGFAGVLLGIGPVLLIVGKLVIGVGSMITAFGSIVSSLRLAIPVFKALNVVMRANVIGIVVTAIAALVAGLIWFFTQTKIGQQIWAGFVSFLGDAWANISIIFQTGLALISTLWTSVWTSIKTFFTGLWAGILVTVRTAIAAVSTVITTVLTAIKTAWTVIWGTVKTVFGAIWAGIVAVVTAYVNAVRTVITTVLNVIRTVWGAVWNGIKTVFGAIWAGIVAFVTGYINTVRNVITTVSNAIRAGWSTVWNAIKTIVSNVWKGILAFSTNTVNAVRTVITNVLNAIRNVWSNVWNAIKTVASNVWNGILSFSTRAVNSVRSVISSVINSIRSIWSSVWGGIKSFFTSIWSNIVSAASGFMGSVRDKFRAVTDFVRGIPGKIVGFFSGLGSKLVASGKSIIQGFLDGIMAGFNKAKSAVSNGLGKIRNLFPFSPAKEGPFSGRGWVAYSGLSIGQTFSESVADSLHDGKKDITGELDSIENEFNRDAEAAFRVSSAVPAMEGTGGANAPAFGAGGLTIRIDSLTVDSEDRVQEVAQELWVRGDRASRSQGKINLGGVTV